MCHNCCIDQIKSTIMTIIYIVTTGNHSEYEIQGVFSTKENAENFIETCLFSFSKYDFAYVRIEEYTLDYAIDFIKKGKHLHQVILFSENGELKECQINPEFVTPKELDFRDCGDYFVGVLFAKSEESAIKITNEKWMQHKALSAQGES